MVTKICDWVKCYDRHRSKDIYLSDHTVLLPKWGSFWQKDSLVTLTLFELRLLWYLAQSQILVTTLYFIDTIWYAIYKCPSKYVQFVLRACFVWSTSLITHLFIFVMLLKKKLLFFPYLFCLFVPWPSFFSSPNYRFVNMNELFC